MISACRIIKVRKNTTTRHVAASRRKWQSRAWLGPAKIAELNLDKARIPEQPSTTIPGKVNKIIAARPNQPEKAQIAVDGADHRHRNLRIENTLTDEHGEDVKLKKGAHVEVTVTAAEPKAFNRRNS
jgi:hypothetical protein